jgi:hypothetical protein
MWFEPTGFRTHQDNRNDVVVSVRPLEDVSTSKICLGQEQYTLESGPLTGTWMAVQMQPFTHTIRPHSFSSSSQHSPSSLSTYGNDSKVSVPSPITGDTATCETKVLERLLSSYCIPLSLAVDLRE